MYRPVAILFAGLLALYLLVHYLVNTPKKEDSPKSTPLPPLMNSDADTRPVPPFCAIYIPPVPHDTPASAQPSITLRTATSFPNGGGFNWDSGSGTPEEIRFKGARILSKAKSGTYCCGFTFAVVMKSAQEAGLLEDKTIAQVRQFQKDWYATTPQSKERQQIYALQKFGIGREVKLMDAQPGDFVRLWHRYSGHSVVFVKWVEENGRKVGFEYRGTQGSTNGIGNRTEYLPDPAQNRAGDFDVKRTYVGRLNPAKSPPKFASSEDALYNILRRVPRYKQLVKTSPHPAYMLDNPETDKYWVVAIGDNFEDHFARWETLRIWKNGKVERSDSAGDWVALNLQ